MLILGLLLLIEPVDQVLLILDFVGFLHNLLLKSFLLCPTQVPFLIFLSLLEHLHGLKFHLDGILLLLFLDLHDLDSCILLLSPFFDDEPPGPRKLLLSLLQSISVQLLLL